MIKYHIKISVIKDFTFRLSPSLALTLAFILTEVSSLLSLMEQAAMISFVPRTEALNPTHREQLKPASNHMNELRSKSFPS